MRIIPILLVLAASLAGQQTFRSFSDAPPPALDPIQSNDLRWFKYFAQAFEPLLEMTMDDKDRCILGPAVTSLPEVSKDGLTLTFRVTAGARFADDPCFADGRGRAVTGKDVVYTLQRVADPTFASPFWETYLQGRIVDLDEWREKVVAEKVTDYDAPVAGLVADGDKVEIRLRGPYPQLLPLLTQPWASVVPREAVSRYGTGFGEHPVGTGPFLFAGRDALGTVRFTRNPNYRIKGRPYLDEVRFEVVADIQKRTDRFLNGDLHLCDLLPQNEERLVDKTGRLRQALKDQGLRLSEGPPFEVAYLVFNFKNALLQRLPIREAFSLAIDRKKVLKALYGDRGLLADSPIPPAFVEAAAVADQPFRYAARDVPAAKKILEQAGFPNGQGLPEFLLDAPGVGQSPRDRAAAEGMVKDLAEAGIRVQLRTDPVETFYERCRKGDLQIAWMTWYADYADVENFLMMLRSGEDDFRTSNYGHYRSEDFDKLYDRIAGMYPSPERTALVVQAVDRLRRDLPWVFLCYPKRAFAVQKGVKGFRYNVLNHSLRDVKLDAVKK